MKIFIGNLHTSADEKSLRALFMPYGEVTGISIVYDNYSKRSRGYGYVEMEDAGGAQSAVTALNNTLFMRQSIVVREAESRGSATSGSHY